MQKLKIAKRIKGFCAYVTLAFCYLVAPETTTDAMKKVFSEKTSD